MFDIGLKPFCEFYKIYDFWFGLIWIQYAKSMKQLRNQKRFRKEKEIEKG
jgi:hypothetical protein